MKKKSATYILIACLGLTILSGVLRGRMDHRWGVSEEVVAAADRVRQIPTSLGPWHLKARDGKLAQLDPQTVHMLRCTGNVVGTYQHERTGQSVNMIFMVGPAGPLAVHTPDVCYTSASYRLTESRKRKVIVDSAGERHEFSVTTFQENRAGNRALRVYYSWNHDGSWTSPSTPRTSFAGLPSLYKIQVSTFHVGGDEDLLDAGEQFLRDSLPVLKDIYKKVHSL